MNSNIKILLVSIFTILLPSLSIYAGSSPLKGRWQFKDTGTASGGAYNVYYPNRMDIVSPANHTDHFDRYMSLMDNIESKTGVIPDVIIWENDTTQTFQFYLFHAFLDEPVDTNYTWSDFRKYLFFRIESIDGKTIFHLPYTFGDASKKMVLRNRKEIANQFFFSFNDIQVPFAINEAYLISLQFFDTPDTTGNVFQDFRKITVVEYKPTTVQDSLVWALSTDQFRKSPDRFSLIKDFAQRMPKSILVQHFYSDILLREGKIEDLKIQYLYMLNLLENKIDSTQPIKSSGGYSLYKDGKLCNEQYFKEKFLEINNAYQAIFPE